MNNIIDKLNNLKKNFKKSDIPEKYQNQFIPIYNAKNLDFKDSKIKKDIISISAGNYGGKLGQYHFHLRKIMK